ncbi:hypothetical protein L484_022855 [Morus notabilis]|uniref:Uncharacterized protein n=1 Tax=Morus notabilis TaxID=981085 RepID=W9S8W9_9ROSA|nr:hypothetical protein L484_022855 [Morus notabilis]
MGSNELGHPWPMAYPDLAHERLAHGVGWAESCSYMGWSYTAHQHHGLGQPYTAHQNHRLGRPSSGPHLDLSRMGRAIPDWYILITLTNC